MNWKSIRLFDLPLHTNVFWRYEFDDGDVRFFCHDRSMTEYHRRTRELGNIKYIHFLNPLEIKL